MKAHNMPISISLEYFDLDEIIEYVKDSGFIVVDEGDFENLLDDEDKEWICNLLLAEGSYTSSVIYEKLRKKTGQQ